LLILSKHDYVKIIKFDISSLYFFSIITEIIKELNIIRSKLD